MKRTSITDQLKFDYPGINISFEPEKSLLVMNNYRISLLLNKEEFKQINVRSRSGRNYYQAVTQLVYSRYSLTPAEGSFADSLITYKEEYNKYRLQNLSRDYGIGFLEDGDDVIAVKVKGDIEKPVMIEEDENLKEKLKMDRRKQELGLDDDFGLLLDVNDE